MQILAILALSSSVLAQNPASIASSLNPVSVNAVLATALPQSIINAIATNSPAAISSIYSVCPFALLRMIQPSSSTFRSPPLVSTANMTAH